ncbi:MAG: NHLP bacteriocin export ABC transporter permease/ATPase subunit [Bacteroidia bacterium]|nr:NHLP bacteriocin export ABC transporter permease/ATPase subunit [Bacteroidia bacterium]
MERKPEEIILGANKPFVLQRSDSVWIVTSGVVEIFYAITDKHGTIKSHRKFLYEAKKGEMLFSLKKEGLDQSLSLIAVSSDAKLIEIRKNYLLSLNSRQLAYKVEKWIEKNAQYLQQAKPPRLYTAIEEQTDISLTKGQFTYPAKGIVWGKLNEGEIGFWGLKPNSDDESRRILKEIIPISNSLWVEAHSQEVQMEILSTQEVLKDEIGLMLSLTYFQSHVYHALVREYKAVQEESNHNLQRKINNNDSIVEGSLQNLRSIIEEVKTTQFDEVPQKDELLLACKQIGNELGVTFKKAQNNGDKATSSYNRLMSIAQVSNVRLRKVILRGEWWKEENGHLLAFTQDEKRPVALIQKKAGKYELRTGSNNSGTVVDKEIAQGMEPMAYMFLPAFDQKMDSVRKVGAFAIKGLKTEFIFIILAALAGSLMTMVVPILSGIMFDDVIPQADREFLLEVVCVMIVVGVVMAFLKLIRGVIQLRVETKSNINLQAGLMDHLLRLPVPFFQRFSTGDLTMRALGINAIRQIIGATFLTAVLSGAFSLVNIFVLFYYDPKLAWIGVGMAVLAVAFVLIIGMLKLRYDRRIAESEGQIQGYLFELLSGISKVRITGAEKRLFAIWAHKFGFLKTLGFKSESYENYSTIFTTTFPLLTNIFFFGAIFYFFQNPAPGTQTASLIQVGIFVAFISAFSQFLNDCLSMSSALIASLDAIPLFERIKPILEEEPESQDGSADPGELSGEIEMNGVSFRYNQDQDLILKNVSFKINAGEMVAFVGPSGSGKSTIMRLLLGFEEAESGSIYYDGQAFDTLQKELVRKQTGVVLQHGALMPGSIYKNIVGNSELLLEQAIEAAEMAGMKEDIDQMPMGMHTVISEGAATFSGGQRQRLMIARAIVHKPRILFMDEATSALDNHTQKIVSDSLDKLQATRIVIAHRLSTVINADKIFVLDKGQIVESGTYHELVRQNGLFSQLAKRQIA